jgi:SHS2 domain-containing protein
MIHSAPSAGRNPGWEHFSHDADVGVRGFGATAAEAFEQAALALTAVITHAKVEPRASVEVRCEAPDLELLFVEWLNALIYKMAIREMLFGRFAVRIQKTMWGEPVDVVRHAPACEAKGATSRHMHSALRLNAPSGSVDAREASGVYGRSPLYRRPRRNPPTSGHCRPRPL